MKYLTIAVIFIFGVTYIRAQDNANNNQIKSRTTLLFNKKGDCFKTKEQRISLLKASNCNHSLLVDKLSSNNKMITSNAILYDGRGNQFRTSDGGKTINILPTQNETMNVNTKDKVIFSYDSFDKNITLYPNPITDNSTLEIELKERSNISVYSYDSQNNKVTYFEGIGEKGTNSVQIQAEKKINGSMILFIDANGKTSIYKAVVAR